MSVHLAREPVYQQLNQALRELLSSGEFAVGARFLTERQISDRFGVSRATANKALSNLVFGGVLEFHKGVGTFVRGCAMDYNLRALVSFTEEALAAGKRPATRVLTFERMSSGQAPESVPQALKTGLDEMLFHMERLRLADELPVILEKRYVVAAHCPELNEVDASGSLYSAWSRKYGLSLAGADQTIRAISLHGSDARLLEVREGAAGMLVSSAGYLTGGAPLWCERTLYRGDAYEFHNRLGGLQSAGFAAGRFLMARTNVSRREP